MTVADPTGSPRIVCILSSARSGSNLLCDALGGISGARHLSELFHRRWIGGGIDADELAAMTANAGGVDGLTQWRALNPGRTLELLMSRGVPGPLIFKVFPGHVETRRLRREVLERSDARIVVLKRRPIDSVISSMKARVVGTCQMVDTTSLRIALDPEYFNAWAHARRRWYRWVDAFLTRHACEPVRISYEHDLSPDPIGAAATVASRLSLPFTPKAGVRFRRQDSEPDFRKRVTNWDDFAMRADPQLLAWATAVPPPALGNASGSIQA